MSGSPKFRLNKEDGKKILTGFLIALGGTALAYLADTLQMVDFGDLQPIAVVLLPILMTAINTGRKLLAEPPAE